MAGHIEGRGGTPFTTYDASVTSVSPDNGPSAGGLSVTVRGSNFLAAASVYFGAAASGAVSVDTDTEITCDSPANAAGVYDVVVTNDGANPSTPLYNAFTVYDPPTVTAIFQAGVPNGEGPAAGGNQIEVRGSDFLSIGGGPTVYIDSVLCTEPEFVTSGIILCIAPAHAAGGPYDVTVVNGDAAAQSGTGVGLYTYV